MLVELYSYIILSPEPLEVSGKKILPYYRFHTHSFWWCQTLILINTEKWNWHITASFCFLQENSEHKLQFSLCVVCCILYIHVQSRSQLVLFVTLFESFDRYLLEIQCVIWVYGTKGARGVD